MQIDDPYYVALVAELKQASDRVYDEGPASWPIADLLSEAASQVEALAQSMSYAIRCIDGIGKTLVDDLVGQLDWGHDGDQAEDDHRRAEDHREREHHG